MGRPRKIYTPLTIRQIHEARKVFNQHLRLGFRMARILRAKPFALRLGSFEDLEQECMRALWKAARHYVASPRINPKTGRLFRFTTLAYKIIPREIIEFGADGGLIRLPKNFSRVPPVSKSQALTVERRVRASVPPLPLPDRYDEPWPERGPDVRPSFEYARELVERLPPKLRRVITLLLGFDNRGHRRTLSEVGAMMGGVSKERIRQLREKAYAFLRHIVEEESTSSNCKLF